jgi:hypothetical protein
MKPDFDMKKLTEVSLEISTLSYTCKVWENKRLHRRGGLISFSGHYPPGSRGTKNATFIKWKLNEFVSLGFPYRLDGLVVDFSELDYVWGDDLSDHPTCCRHDFPILTVITEERREAFAGVLNNNRLRTNLRAALAEMDEIIRHLGLSS